ncbi:MAG: glucosyltransferase, partial [Anaerolineae bacterium]
RFLPLLVALGMGLSLSNAGAVLRAVLGVRGEFKRTPKFDIKQSADSWVGSVYALRGDWLVWAELLLAGMVLVLLVLPTTRWTFMPWLLLYATGFGYVALVNLYQTYQVRRFLHGARQPRST